MFSKTISSFALVISLLAKSVVSDDSVMYYDIKNLSLKPPYINQGLRNVDWSFGNSTIMEINNYIRLTPNLPSKQGWLWSKVPLISSSWEIEFEYKIHGKNNNNGDGFAFFYSKERAVEGDAFGNIQNFKGMGIFFDTFANSKHGYAFPRISGMVGDGQLTYNRDNDGEDSVIDACSMKIRDQNHSTKAKIVYIKDKYLEVSLTNDENTEYVNCFTINNPQLPNSGYIGFTASTGEASDNHDIISVTTKGILEKFVGKTGQRKMIKNTKPALEVSKKDTKFSIFVIGLLLTICGFVIYTLKNVNPNHKKYFQSKSRTHGHFN
ncbi:hypothetical protein BCR36DRAFT_412057 [Piromyces finnis]|uniref:L-type lectin-like domain-containing protein n=1 Tax=Piromyces finnis TaxID=1754191 RepID=A0A1Y1VA78_9FUNG|nr:hypothetical protein BCR36DRAFT_412057 [Piromyces finnis]|eukprot:ORX51076.1 hypothetical protein BCR36DRAFT_412057 [Piromyces finnis]